MWDSVTTGINSYLNFYSRFFSEQWRDMSPMKYGLLLISIGVVGFLLMKNGNGR